MYISLPTFLQNSLALEKITHDKLLYCQQNPAIKLHMSLNLAHLNNFLMQY